LLYKTHTHTHARTHTHTRARARVMTINILHMLIIILCKTNLVELILMFKKDGFYCLFFVCI